MLYTHDARVTARGCERRRSVINLIDPVSWASMAVQRNSAVHRNNRRARLKNRAMVPCHPSYPSAAMLAGSFPINVGVRYRDGDDRAF